MIKNQFLKTILHPSRLAYLSRPCSTRKNCNGWRPSKCFEAVKSRVSTSISLASTRSNTACLDSFVRRVILLYRASQRWWKPRCFENIFNVFRFFRFL